MDRWRRRPGSTARRSQEGRRQWRKAHAAYLAGVLDEVAERGPLTASQLTDPRRRDGEWWDRRSDGRRALELLFEDGVLAAWRSPELRAGLRPGRAGDPAVGGRACRRRPPRRPSGSCILLAAGCLGVGTVADLADYFWIRPKQAAPRVAELVEDGRLVPVAVEGWDKAAYLRARRPAPDVPRRQHATLLSPFDSLIWTPQPDRAPVRLPLPHRDLRARAPPHPRLLRAAAPAR